MFFTTTLRHFNIVKVLTSIWFKLVLITFYILQANFQPIKMTIKRISLASIHTICYQGKHLFFVLIQ